MGRRKTPEQIISILCEAEVALAQRRDGGADLSPSWCVGAELLPLAQGIWRLEDGSSQAIEGA